MSVEEKEGLTSLSATHQMNTMWYGNQLFTIEYEIFGEGSHISTDRKRENSAFSPLIG